MELTPKTRKETFLAAAAGQDVTTPTPITREEVFLDAIAKSGGGGGGSSGGGALKVGVTVTQSVDETIYTLDKTYKQIVDAVNSGIIPYCFDEREGSATVNVLKDYYSSATHYFVSFGNATYSTTSEYGYPSYSAGGK